MCFLNFYTLVFGTPLMITDRPTTAYGMAAPQQMRIQPIMKKTSPQL